MNADEMMRNAIEAADAARCEARLSFQRKWGVFLKCTHCGARNSKTSHCGRCDAKAVKWHSYTSPALLSAGSQSPFVPLLPQSPPVVIIDPVNAIDAMEIVSGTHHVDIVISIGNELAEEPIGSLPSAYEVQEVRRRLLGLK